MALAGQRRPLSAKLDVKFAVKLSNELMDDLEYESQESGTPQSVIVRDALRQHLDYLRSRRAAGGQS